MAIIKKHRKLSSSKKKKLSNELLAGELLPLNEFLKKYKISKNDFKKTGLRWEELKSIFKHYQSLKDKLEHPAAAIVAILFTKEAKDQGVHSVRYRIKDANSVIEKIIRKKIENLKRDFNIDNYSNEITDLIGIRILHTFKYDWFGIDGFIKEMFVLKKGEKPIVYYRVGDDENFLNMCKINGCKKLKHEKNYRSVHYVIATQLTKRTYYAEIQVRTIFEEGWSEIDHKIRYTYKGHAVTPFDSELKNLNSITGSADETATIIKKREQEEQERILKPKNKKGKK